MRVCLIAEKPSLAIAVLPVIREIHPGLDGDAFASATVNPYSHLNERFRYPRGLRWQDYPFSGEPEYEPFRFGYRSMDGRWSHQVRLSPELLHTHGNDHPDRRLRTHDTTSWAEPAPQDPDPRPEAERRFRRANVVYAAIDPEDSSWLSLDHALSHLALSPATEVRIPLIDCLWGDAMRAAFRSPGGHGDDAYVGKVRRARISRRFDYAYQVNALAVLRRTLAAAGGEAGDEVPSKFALQTLYLLRATGPIGEARLINAMQTWRGSGRYPRCRYSGIGNAASRGPIVHSLLKAGLAESDRCVMGVSHLGRRFLDLLHPDCEDPDLRFRIEAWKELPEADAAVRIDRYVRTFFGKQIRYLAKAARHGLTSRGIPGR